MYKQWKDMHLAFISICISIKSRCRLLLIAGTLVWRLANGRVGRRGLAHRGGGQRQIGTQSAGFFISPMSINFHGRRFRWKWMAPRRATRPLRDRMLQPSHLLNLIVWASICAPSLLPSLALARSFFLFSPRHFCTHARSTCRTLQYKQCDTKSWSLVSNKGRDGVSYARLTLVISLKSFFFLFGITQRAIGRLKVLRSVFFFKRMM